MKTKEELNEIKEEVETLNKKLHELTDEEPEQVTGGQSKKAKVAARMAGEVVQGAVALGGTVMGQ